MLFYETNDIWLDILSFSPYFISNKLLGLITRLLNVLVLSKFFKDNPLHFE
jgi:hypothetical protein